MSSYHLIGRDWTVADGLTFLGESTAPLRSHVPVIARALNLTDAPCIFFFQCADDHTPLTHLDLDKSLDAQQVPVNGYIYVGVTAEEETTPKARAYAASRPRRGSTDRRERSTAAAAARTPISPTAARPSQVAAPRQHAMTASSGAGTAVVGAANPAVPHQDTQTASGPHPVKKLRFADEGSSTPGLTGFIEADAAATSPDALTSAAPTTVPTSARSAMKSSAVLSSSISEASHSPRVHVDPNPPVVIEADASMVPLPDAACPHADLSAKSAPVARTNANTHGETPTGDAPHRHCRRASQSSEVASILADIGCEGLAADTRSAARPLLLRLAQAILLREPDDVETCVVDMLCSEQLHSDTVSTNLTASAPSRLAGVPETHEIVSTDNNANSTTIAAGAGETATATKGHEAGAASSGEDVSYNGGAPSKDGFLTFAPVGDTVAEKLTFGSPCGPGRALVARLVKLVLDVKPADPEEFLHIHLSSRTFGEEAAMTTLMTRTVDPETVMAVEDPTIASLLRGIPVESPGFNVAANLLPALFSRKPENPVNYMFDHLSGRARSSYAASMRSSMKMPRSGMLGSNVDVSYAESCTSRDDDDVDLDQVEGEEDAPSESAASPYFFDGIAAGRPSPSSSSNVAQFLRALQRHNSADKLRASDADQPDISQGSPVSLHVHLSDSVSSPRRVSIARGGERRAGSGTAAAGITRTGSGYSSSNHAPRAAGTGGSPGRPGQYSSLCSTPTTGRRGEADQTYPLTTDRHSSRVSHASAAAASADARLSGRSSRARGGDRRDQNGPCAVNNVDTMLTAASLLSPVQRQTMARESAQQLALMELQVQRMQVELTCRRRTREYQERMTGLDAADGDGVGRRSGSLKRAIAAEKETARYVDALQEQQQTLMALVEALNSGSGASASLSPRPQDDALARRLDWMALEQEHMRSMIESLFVRNGSVGRL